jgi:bifunctional DNase/RNase
MNIGSPVEVKVKSLLFLNEKGVAVILLEGPNGAWGLPILAKSLEVTSITFALEGTEPPRPLSHNLMACIIENLQSRILQVLIDILEEPLCHGIIAVDVRGREIDFDSRPSDAIALALRANVPIFVSPAVVAKGAIYFDKGKWPADLEGKVKLEN